MRGGGLGSQVRVNVFKVVVEGVVVAVDGCGEGLRTEAGSAVETAGATGVPPV